MTTGVSEIGFGIASTGDVGATIWASPEHEPWVVLILFEHVEHVSIRNWIQTSGCQMVSETAGHIYI